MWGLGTMMGSQWTYSEGPSYDGSLGYSERIGASLLRPAPGWLGTTGAVYGTVLSGDIEAGRTRVFLMFARIGSDGRPGQPVTRISNWQGQFVVEGLDPGKYVVVVYGTWFNPWGGVASVHPTVRLEAVEVRAGERTGPLVLTVRHRDYDLR